MLHVMNAIADAFDKDLESTINYKDLLVADKDSSLYDILNAYEAMVSHYTLIVAKIIRQKYGLATIHDDLYKYILEFPAHLNRLEKEIDKNEGFICSVDKAWTRSIEELKELIEEGEIYESHA